MHEGLVEFKTWRVVVNMCLFNSIKVGATLQVIGGHLRCVLTLPETNISAPENRPLETEIPFLETIIFRGKNVSFREGICIYHIYKYACLLLGTHGLT